MRFFRNKRIRFLAWFQSVHAKLFLVTGVVTSLLTLIVAYSIIRNSRREMLEYTKNLAIRTAEVVETDIVERDPEFKDPRKIEEVLESLAGPEYDVFQIDIFKSEGRSTVNFVVSSVVDDDKVEWGSGIGTYMLTPGSKAELVELDTGNMAWKVYTPIRSPKANRPPIGLIRTYCDLKNWEVIWKKNLTRTYKILPPILMGEFILLWVILAWLLNDPLKIIMGAMARLEQGDADARADVKRRDELGRIASRFNLMAAQLQRAASERETLIQEIRGLNLGLQDRIDKALEELQAKNRELETLMDRIAILREELGQQERLAVAGQLTAAFAHEVGTPLNLVNGHLQLLLSQSDLTDKTRERLGVIQAQIQRVGDIVRKLLGHTRRPQLHQETIAFATLIADLQRLWNPTLSSHRIAFESDIPDDCTLLVDRKQMEQLFINLVNNAADAMSDGGRIRLMVCEDASASAALPRWEVALEDEGTGIPEDVLPMVFKPMFTTKPEGKGTGLGLAICREIVRAHGGEIRLENREPNGTTVKFTLPRAQRI